MSDPAAQAPYTSPLLRPLNADEQRLLETVASPVMRETHGWPTWDYVDLTFRRDTGLEARPILAGLPWFPLGLQMGDYRLVWFSEHVPAGSAPFDGRIVVGLTVAGMCALSPSGGARGEASIDTLAWHYRVVLRTLAASLLNAVPDPGGVVDTSISLETVNSALHALTVDEQLRRSVVHDLVLHEPPTALRTGERGDARVAAVYPLDALAQVDSPREYVEVLTALYARKIATAQPERRPTDLVDALGRLDLVFRAVLRTRLWREFPVDQFARLVIDPTSATDYRDALSSLAAVIEAMSVPEVAGLEKGVKSITKLAAFLGAYLDPERHAEVDQAIQGLRDIVALRQGIAHANDKAARAAASAARRLEMPPPATVTDYPAAYDVVARAAIGSVRAIADLLVEADDAGRPTPAAPGGP